MTTVCVFIFKEIMGCVCARLFKKENKNITEEPYVKQYSWDKRQNVNNDNFTLQNLDDKEIVKMPGSMDGEQIIVQNCKNSTIYILDHMNTVTIDDCNNCKIILGPVKGCVFLRNCTDSTFVTACSQFRTRDCRKLNIFLFCVTQPIIETSFNINFGNYQLYYTDIYDHLMKAGLNILSRDWEIIYDFTPVENEINWSFMEDKKVEEFVKSPKNEEVENCLKSLNQTWKSVIQNEVLEPNEQLFVMESSI